jgi:hypothetical protein
VPSARYLACPLRVGPVLTVPGAPPTFHVMAELTGAVCKLDCEYCFFLSKRYGDKIAVDRLSFVVEPGW